jgi:hypothetical protein
MQKCRLALFVCKSVGPGHRGKPSEKKPLPPVGGLEPGALSRQSCEQGTAGYNRAYLSTPSIYSCTVRNFCRNPIQPYCTYSRTADYYRYRYTAVLLPCTLAVYRTCTGTRLLADTVPYGTWLCRCTQAKGRVRVQYSCTSTF